MKKLFDPHRHKLTEGEKEFVWRRINEPGDLRARRRALVWRRWGYSSAVVLAALLVAILWRPESNMDKLHQVPVPSEVAPQLGAERILGYSDLKAPGTLEEAAVQLDDKAPGTASENMAAAKSAAPVESKQFSTVAPPETAHRDAADVDPVVEKEGLSIQEIKPFADKNSPALAEIKIDPAPVEEFSAKTLGTRGERVEANQGLGAVTGVVIDQKTGAPLPYANLIVLGMDFGTMTLEDGSFKMLLPPGTYTIKCLYMGYENVLAEGIKVWKGYSDSLQFALAPSVALTTETIIVEGEKSTVTFFDSSERKSISDDDLKNFAVDNVEEAMALQAGIVMQGGELHVRGGRSGEATFKIDGVGVNDPPAGTEIQGGEPRYSGPKKFDEMSSLVPPSAIKGETEDYYKYGHPVRRHRCWIPPWYNNPNGEAFDAMYFENYGTNPFVMTDEDALSTFALDVDNASYTLTRSYLERGELPPKDAVRVEEFINFFEQGYESCEDETFCINIDGAPSPYGEGYHLLRVGVQTREITQRERKPANLIFVVDTSGSMSREDRLGLVKQALMILLDELEESDTVGIVEYGSHGRVVLRPTAVEDRRRIEQALNSLHSNGSTNAEEGLWLGYEMAAKLDTKDTNTRLILCSDGVANTGETQAEKILSRVRLESDRGVALSTIGFGMGNYNDVLMEKLADKGDGNYYYVDTLDEAARVFRENLSGTLQTLARDAKIQVEFDPEYVLRWRLIGYENRDIADEDFRNDEVDAGELGSGHQATALYEIKLSDEAVSSRSNRRKSPSEKLGQIHLRYEHPKHSSKAGEIEELTSAIELAAFQISFVRADYNLQLDAMVAEFAEILRGSYWAKDGSFDELISLAKGLRTENPYDEDLAQLHDLIQRAARIDNGKRD
jgi:Ca-activated chloride channel homolog